MFTKGKGQQYLYMFLQGKEKGNNTLYMFLQGRVGLLGTDETSQEVLVFPVFCLFSYLVRLAISQPGASLLIYLPRCF